LKDALCGCNFEIVHLNGKTLAITNVSNVTVIYPGFRRTVPQMGMRRDAVVGNLVIEFDVEFPNSLNPEQIERLKTVF
jgi:DnaJ family protein A protein 2